jgi:protein TonB
MWKTPILLLLIVLPSFAALSQKKKKDKAPETVLYVFDKDWKPCKVKDDPQYLVCEDKLSDSTYQVRFYQFTGPLIRVETYTDETKTTLNGFFGSYDHLGQIDSCGYTYMGKKDKEWMYFNDTMHVTRSEKYDKGKLIEAKDEATLRTERAEQKKLRETHQPGESEASFHGGDKNWRTYLEKNIQFPKRGLNLRKSGKVLVYFAIDAEGGTSDIWIGKSVEYSFDEESIRLIKTAPGWEPAVRNGKKAKAWRIQPITFTSQSQ